MYIWMSVSVKRQHVCRRRTCLSSMFANTSSDAAVRSFVTERLCSGAACQPAAVLWRLSTRTVDPE